MQQVEQLLDNIRKKMDTEFGCNQQDRRRIVEDSRLERNPQTTLHIHDRAIEEIQQTTSI